MTLNQKIRVLNHKRIDALRALKLHLSDLLFSPFSRSVSRQFGSILVLRMDGKLGDSVTATGFLRELKKKHNNCKLIVVASKETAAVYNKLNYVDQTLVTQKGVFSTLALYWSLKKENYKFIINTSHILNPRVIFLTSFLPAEKKISIENKDYKAFTDHISVDFKNEHITDRYKKILRLVGCEATDLSYQVLIPEDVLVQAKKYIVNKIGSAKKIVAINSFAGAKLRNFSQKTTSAIVRRLLNDPDIVVISLANSGDMKIINQWIDQTFMGRWIASSAPHSLEMNMALMKLADIVITPDTAWVHIASAMNKKLIAVYREDTNRDEVNSVIWAPYNKDHQIIFAPSTANNPDDINNVDIDRVVKETLNQLNRN